MDYFKDRIRTKHFVVRLLFKPSKFVAFMATMPCLSPQMPEELSSSYDSRQRIRRDHGVSSLLVLPPTHDRILTNVIQVRSIKPVPVPDPREEDLKAGVYVAQLRFTNWMHCVSLPLSFDP